MKETGQKLKTKREALQITISEAAMSTKINPKIIRSMEDGDLDKLPAKSFLRGFVKSYAQFLKLDEKEIMQSFSDEVGKTQVLTPPPADPQAETEEAPKIRKGTAISITSKTVAIAGVFVLLLGIVIVRKIMEKYERERELPASPPQELSAISPLPATPAQIVAKPGEGTSPDLKPSELPPAQGNPTAQQTPGPAQESAAVLARTPSPSLQPSANSANGNPNSIVKPPVAVPAPTPSAIAPPTLIKPPVQNTAGAPISSPGAIAQKPLPGASTPSPTGNLASTPTVAKPAPAVAAPALPLPTKPIPPAAAPAPSQQAAQPAATPPTSAAAAPPPAQPTPAPTPPAAPIAKPVELIVEALNTVTLTFLIDNKEKKMITLGPDQIHTIKGKQAVALDLSDGGAVNIIYNGRDRGVPGDLGKPKSLKFP